MGVHNKKVGTDWVDGAGQELEGTVRLHAVRQTDSTSRLRLYTSAVELGAGAAGAGGERETVKYQGGGGGRIQGCVRLHFLSFFTT